VEDVKNDLAFQFKVIEVLMDDNDIIVGATADSGFDHETRRQ
jgi:hypothetical protein